MTAAPPRALLCSHRRGAVAQRAYETPLAVEVDAGSRYEVSRRRVFFDEVRLVTLHRERRIGYLLGTGVGALALSALWVSLARGPGDLWRLYLFMWAITALPLLIAFGLRLALGVDVVTVQGRRTRAELRFAFRKQRARQVFERLCRRVREAQGVPPPA